MGDRIGIKVIRVIGVSRGLSSELPHTQTPAVLSAVLCKKPASEPLQNATELHARLSAAENAAGLYEDHAQPAERTAEDSSAGWARG